MTLKGSRRVQGNPMDSSRLERQSGVELVGGNSEVRFFIFLNFFIAGDFFCDFKKILVVHCLSYGVYMYFLVKCLLTENWYIYCKS